MDQVKTYEKMNRVSLKHQTNLRDKGVFIFQDFLPVSKTAGQGSIKKQQQCKAEQNPMESKSFNPRMEREEGFSLNITW